MVTKNRIRQVTEKTEKRVKPENRKWKSEIWSWSRFSIFGFRFSKSYLRFSIFLAVFAFSLFYFLLCPRAACAQQPQAQSGQPIYAVNAKYVNGVAPGYWPTAGSGLTLNLSAGTAQCGNPPAPVAYAGGTLTMAASATSYVYLDPTQSCAPASVVYIASPPSAPSLSQVSGGSLAATTYYVQITYVNAHGETSASSESSLAVSANYYLQVASPASVPGATGWNVYVGTYSGGEYEVNSAPITIGTAATMPWTACNNPYANGSCYAIPPVANSTGMLPGEVPVAEVVTSASAITSITDLRSWSADPNTQGAVVRADLMPGADACAKIAAAVAALPAAGGTVDAREFTGQQPCSSDPLAPLEKNFELLLGGNVVFNSSVSWGSSPQPYGPGSVVIRGGQAGAPGSMPTRLNFTGATEGLVVGAGWKIYDLAITGNYSTSTYGLDVSHSVSFFVARNILVSGWQQGWRQYGNNTSNLCYDCVFAYNSQYGIYIATGNPSGGFPTNTHFIGGATQRNSGVGAYVGWARGIRFDHFLFNTNTGDGIQLGAGSGENAQATVFRDCWFEGNGTSYTSNYDIKAVRVTNLGIYDSVFGSSNATPLHVYRNDNLSGSQAEYVQVVGGMYLGGHPVVLDANVQGVQLLNTGLSDNGILTDNATGTLVLERNSIKENLNILGTVTEYDSLATVERGVPASVENASASAQSANISATTIYSSAPAGRYVLCGTATVTQQATTSATMVTINAIYTNNTDSVAKTISVAVPISPASNPSTGYGVTGCSGPLNVKAGTNVQYSTTNYASSGATSMQYDLYLILEAR